MKIYALIGWDYKPAHTSLYYAADSEEAILDYIRKENLFDSWYDMVVNGELTEEELCEKVKNASYDEIRTWMYENTKWIIDSCEGKFDLTIY